MRRPTQVNHYIKRLEALVQKSGKRKPNHKEILIEEGKCEALAIEIENRDDLRSAFDDELPLINKLKDDLEYNINQIKQADVLKKVKDIVIILDGVLYWMGIPGVFGPVVTAIEKFLEMMGYPSGDPKLPEGNEEDEDY